MPNCCLAPANDPATGQPWASEEARQAYADQTFCPGDACLASRCDLAASRCVQAPQGAGCCQADADCEDGLACTADGCVGGSQCTHDRVPDCCEDDGECPDVDPCTVARCVDHACVHDPDPAAPPGCDAGDPGPTADDAGVPDLPPEVPGAGPDVPTAGTDLDDPAPDAVVADPLVPTEAGPGETAAPDESPDLDAAAPDAVPADAALADAGADSPSRGAAGGGCTAGHGNADGNPGVLPAFLAFLAAFVLGLRRPRLTGIRRSSRSCQTRR